MEPIWVPLYINLEKPILLEIVASDINPLVHVTETLKAKVRFIGTYRGFIRCNFTTNGATRIVMMRCLWNSRYVVVLCESFKRCFIPSELRLSENVKKGGQKWTTCGWPVSVWSTEWRKLSFVPVTLYAASCVRWGEVESWLRFS